MTDSQGQPGVRELPCFRLLIIGQSGVGKTSLINQAFGVDLPVAHRFPGEHDIEKENISSHNDMFILHDSEGFEEFVKDPKAHTVNNFIERRLKQSEVKDQLHAIWLCCSLSENTPFSMVHQKVLTTYCDQLPVVMVFTQLDVFTAETRTTVQVDHPNEDQITIDDLVKKEVGRRLQDEYLKPLQDVTGKAKFPHAVVSVNAPYGRSVQRLVETTQKLLTEQFGPLANKSVTLSVSVAQRVNPDVKIESSIEIALKDALELLDNESSLDDCLGLVHRNLIDIWNFGGDDEQLLSKERWLPRLRSGLQDAYSENVHGISPLQKKNIVADLIIYVTHLIFVLRAIFVKMRTAGGLRSLDDTLIDAVFNAYMEKRRVDVRTAVHRSLNPRGNSTEISSEAAAQCIRNLMRGSVARFGFTVNIPTLPPPQARTNTAASPVVSLPGNHKDESAPPPSKPVVLGAREDERLFAKGTDDGDVVIGTVELKTKRTFSLPGLASKHMKIKVVKTQQKFIQVGPELCKWTACLKFRLEVGGARSKSLKMTGTLWNDPKEGVFEITALHPPAPTGDQCDYTLRHESATAATAEIGFKGPIPQPKLSISLAKKMGWDETRQVVLTTFDNVSPRKEFAMKFTPLPGKKFIPTTLAFIVQVTYPGERALFTLDLQFSSGEYKDKLTVICDGVTEIKKSVDFIPWDPRLTEG